MSRFSKLVNSYVGGFVLTMLALAIVPVFAPRAAAQALNYGNNYFVTGDYVVAGAYNVNSVFQTYPSTGSTLYTIGTIKVPDTTNLCTSCALAGQPNTGNTGATSVPMGATIVAAFLYWETVESASISPGDPGSGKNGFFLPAGTTAPQGLPGYPISGVNLTGQNNVAWSNGGCPGSSTGRVVRVYRASVIHLLPQDGQGNLLAGSSTAPQTYQVIVPSSSNGSVPITLGATLVIIYRVFDASVPLNSIVIYDGAFGQSTINGTASLNMTQLVQGFYDAAPDATRVTRLTHIVGSGQSNKFQTVYFGTDPNNLTALPNLYGGQAAFPGWYGDFDNPTWTFDKNSTNPANPLTAGSAQVTTKVVPSTSQQGCVIWGAVITSTTVDEPDQDGLLKVWKSNQWNSPGYCDVAINPGTCQGPTDSSWVSLSGSPAQPGDPGAQLGTPDNPHPDIFVQLDYMCQNKQSGTNACGPGYSFNPYLTMGPDGKNVVQEVIDAFADNTKHQKVNVHVFPTWAIQEQTCTDSTAGCGNPVKTPYPNQPGVVYWKGGFIALKNELLKNDGSGDHCTDNTGATCVRRFQHGRKDSWHYAVFAHALGRGRWNFYGGLTDPTGAAPPNGVISQSVTAVTFYTSTAHGLIVDSNAGNGRVTINDAISNPNLNGTYLVTNTDCPVGALPAQQNCSVSNTAPGPYAFTINLPTSAGAQPSYTQKTDPNLSVGSGKAGSVGGWSDVGGGDSAITLGNWLASDVTWNVKAGTFMHEVGHTLALTHGGFYYDNLAHNPNDYRPTFGENCKPNFLSVMNYLFSIDLLDNHALDFAEESTSPLGTLPLLNEHDGPSTGFSSIYSNTSWYAPTNTAGGTPATRHCDGSPILDGAQMTAITNEPTTSLLWIPPQDINFDGNASETFRGHSDWKPALNDASSPGIDLRQIGGTGSTSVVGGGQIFGSGGGQIFGSGGGQIFGSGGGQIFGSGGGQIFGSGGGQIFGSGGGQIFGAGGGQNQDEPTHESANSFARPPRNLTATEGVSPRTITLTWDPPIFGTPIYYKVYRSTAGGPFNPLPGTVSPTPGPTGKVSFTDTVSCNTGGYSYKVTSTVLADITNQQMESLPSNTAPAANPSPLTGCYTNTPGTVALNDLAFSGPNPVVKTTVVPVTWSLQDDDTGVYVQRPAASTALSAIGPVSNDTACASLTVPPSGTTVTSVSTSGSGIQFGVTGANQFSFGWNTTTFNAGCYFFRLDLDSGQSEVTASAWTLLIWVSDSAFPTLTTTLPNATLNKSYSNTLVQAGGFSPFTWTKVSGSLPSGMSLSSSGTVSGKPGATGTYVFGVKVTDSKGNYGTQTFTLPVCKASGC